MNARDRAWVESAINHAEMAMSYASSRGPSWTQTPETIDAIVSRITQLGECVKSIGAGIKAAYPLVPWREIAQMRDFIVHHYGRIDVQVLQSTVEKSLPQLVKNLKDILGEA